ncbi:MAG TPA: hypothetical protein VK464_09345, partial [Symbiobacteriaceae bacterium]|nr:hypothetical protein [Symbiobacteriaceae bacterium]
MASPRLVATIELQDNLTARLEKAARSLDRFAQKVSRTSKLLADSLSPDLDRPARKWEQFAHRVRTQFAQLTEGLRWAFVKAGTSFLLVGSTAVTAGVRAIAKFLDLKTAVLGVVQALVYANAEIARLARALGTLKVEMPGETQEKKTGWFSEIFESFEKMLDDPGAQTWLKRIGLDPASIDRAEGSVYSRLKKFGGGLDEELAGLSAIWGFGQGLFKKFGDASGLFKSAGKALGGEEAVVAAGSAFTRQGAMGGVRTLRQFGKVGKAAPWLAAGVAAIEVAFAKPGERSRTAFDKLGNLAGGIVGAKMGAGIGAALGSFVPIIGTGIGAGLGALIGGIVGSLAGERFATVFRQKGLGAAIVEVMNFLGELLIKCTEWIGQALGWVLNAVVQGIAWLAGAIWGSLEQVLASITEWWQRPDKWQWLGQAILDAIVNGFWAAVNKLKEWGGKIWDWIKGTAGDAVDAFNSGRSTAKGTDSVTVPVHHRGGIAEEGMAVLKRKEMVLDPALSDFIRGSAARSAGQGRDSAPVTVQIGSLAGTVHVREEADLQRIAKELVREL